MGPRAPRRSGNRSYGGAGGLLAAGPLTALAVIWTHRRVGDIGTVRHQPPARRNRSKSRQFGPRHPALITFDHRARQREKSSIAPPPAECRANSSWGYSRPVRGGNEESRYHLFRAFQLKTATGRETLFRIEINFEPNQATFFAEQYSDRFDEAIAAVKTTDARLIFIEGHSDPLGILKAEQEGKPSDAVAQMRLPARKLSRERAEPAPGAG